MGDVGAPTPGVQDGDETLFELAGFGHRHDGNRGVVARSLAGYSD